MKLINMTCPNCGSQLQVDAENKQATCEFCGNILLIDDGVQHVQYDNAEMAGYEFEKGRQRAQNERLQQYSQISIGNNGQSINNQGKKSYTWLWVLGWIFMFPVPLTILVIRNQKLETKWKIGIIAAAWIAYIIMALLGRAGKAAENTNTSGSLGNTSITTCYIDDYNSLEEMVDL